MARRAHKVQEPIGGSLSCSLEEEFIEHRLAMRWPMQYWSTNAILLHNRQNQCDLLEVRTISTAGIRSGHRTVIGLHPKTAQV